MNNMDPLFERREMTTQVHIHSKFICKNIVSSILAQLKMNIEGRCSGEGFIQRNSVTIIKYSIGRINYIKGGVDYNVTFQADVCMPHIGQRFKGTVTTKSKIGIHTETPPIKVLVPRDLHIGNADFESVKIGDEIEFEVLGSQFKQQDPDIIVVAKLLTKVDAPVEKPLLTTSEVKFDVPPDDAPAEEVRRVVTTAEEPKKVRKLRRTTPETT